MKTYILLFILYIPTTLSAQDNKGIIYPGNSFLNKSPDTLFYLPKQKLEIIIEREEISNAIIQIFTERDAESDSLLSLKTREAYDWYNKLMETDSLFEKSELQQLKEKQKARTQTRIWFGMGVITGLIAGVVL
jgi:hypothetical protein